MEQRIKEVFCDKISITLEPSTAIKEAVSRFVEWEWSASPSSRAKKLYSYFKGVNLHVSKLRGINQYLRIECSPRYPDRSFLRVEFNPSKCDPIQVVRCFERIHPDLHSLLISDGLCSRYDATVNVENIHISQLVAHASYKKEYSAYRNDGVIQTCYYGSEWSGSRVCVYDLNVNMVRLKLEPPPFPVTRIEVRKAVSVPMSFLTGEPNAFKNFHVNTLETMPLEGDSICKLVAALSVLGHGQHAYNILSKEEKRKYRRAIDKVRPEWWDVEKIWSGWRRAVEPIFNPEITLEEWW